MKNPNKQYTDRLQRARKIISRVRSVAIESWSDPVADDLTDCLHNLDNAVKKLVSGKITDAAQNGICPHCKGKIAIRNPKGFCDHLYYPDNCKVCKKRELAEDVIRVARETLSKCTCGDEEDQRILGGPSPSCLVHGRLKKSKRSRRVPFSDESTGGMLLH